MYGFNVQVKDNFNSAVQRVTDALKTEGFGVLTDIDVQATMKAKLGVDGKPYRILGACNPSLAHQAIMDPIAVLRLTDNPNISERATEVRGRLERVAAQLK